MNGVVWISASLANCSVDTRDASIAREVSELVPEVAIYRRQPAPGVVFASVFNWMAIVGLSADLLALGQALWKIKEKVDASARANPNSDPFMIVQICSGPNQFRQIVIRPSDTSENQCLDALREAVHELTGVHVPQFVDKDALIRRIESHGGWVRVRHYGDSS
ncbi:hypothetical protein [Ahniella affigens]|uniref:hypothetical protein n=1 Tax=Ahniella affigens TaxID=2021234 RepID=UPI0011B1DDE5|nr:hypothetical protein [Ahniella affigens]